VIKKIKPTLRLGLPYPASNKLKMKVQHLLTYQHKINLVNSSSLKACVYKISKRQLIKTF